MKKQKPELAPEADITSKQRSYDKEAVSRLLHNGSIEFAEQPPQFELTEPYVKRPEGDCEQH